MRRPMSGPQTVALRPVPPARGIGDELARDGHPHTGASCHAGPIDHQQQLAPTLTMSSVTANGGQQLQPGHGQGDQGAARVAGSPRLREGACGEWGTTVLLPGRKNRSSDGPPLSADHARR